MHAGGGGQVPGDDKRRVDVMYDERHRDQLSGGDVVCSGVVHVLGWAELVQQLRRRLHHQHGLEHGGHVVRSVRRGQVSRHVVNGGGLYRRVYCR